MKLLGHANIISDGYEDNKMMRFSSFSFLPELKGKIQIEIIPQLAFRKKK